MTIFKVNHWAKSKLLTGPSWGTKKGQLGPVNNIENLRAQFSFYKQCCAEAPIFIVFLTNSVKKTNLAQLITLKMAKLGPVNNSTEHIYIYTYICSYKHTYIYTYIHTYTHIYIYTGCLAGIGTANLE